MKLRDASCRLSSSSSSEGGILKRNLIKNMSYILICSHIHPRNFTQASHTYFHSATSLHTRWFWFGRVTKKGRKYSLSHSLHAYQMIFHFFSFFKNRFSRKNVDDRNFRFSFRFRFFSNHLFVSEKPTDRQT